MKHTLLIIALFMTNFASAGGSSLNGPNSFSINEGGCPGTLLIYLPNSTANQGPALYVCDSDPAPLDYHLASDQACAQARIDADPYCLTNFWDAFCNSEYNICAYGCASYTIYLPIVMGAGPAMIVCDDDPAPEGYIAAADQACAQTVINNDPFCLVFEWDYICQRAYYNCLYGCSSFVSVYLPGPSADGPAVLVCSGDPAPLGYLIAENQSCAINIIYNDPYCLVNNWDSICEEAYYTCRECEVYLPSAGNSGPAIIVCDGNSAPEGYTLASSQPCARAVIEDDPFCLDTNWDTICQSAYDLCRGEGCPLGPQNLVYLPNEGVSGPAIEGCGLVPFGYSAALVKPCAKAVTVDFPSCIDTNWDSVCQSAYDACTGESCDGETSIFVPISFFLGPNGPVIEGCGITPYAYYEAHDQACAQMIIDEDPWCYDDWDDVCYFNYLDCVTPPCQVPTDLDVVENGFGTANPSVNATWVNPNETTYCEVRGGRISVASYNAGEPEFANIANTQVITQTNGTTVNFNIALYNNPNTPFTVGQRYGFDVRCQCSDGSDFTEWANISPESTFVVPAPPPGVDPGGDSKLLTAGIDVVNVFPNPAGEMVNIELEMFEEGSVEIELQNTLGQVVLLDRISGKSAVSRLDVSDLEAGIYMLSVRTPTGMITERLIIK